MAHVADFDIQHVIDYLQGTLYTLNSAVNELYPNMTEADLTAADLQQIDNQLFNCNECGWWYEVSELADNNDEECICESCYEEINY